MEPRGTLIAYAAGAGEFAIDAAPGAANGLFTAKFVEALREPGLEASDLFRRVRREVFAASNEEQRPALYDDLDYPFVFRPELSTAISAVDGGGAAAVARQQETVFWQSIQPNPTVAKYEAYLSQYPDGAFAALARLGAAELRDGGGGAPRPAPGRVPDGWEPARPAADPVPRGYRVGEVFRDCTGCPPMVVVPAGTFTMGSPASEAGRFENESPQRRVTIPEPLAVGVYEVTFSQWDACVSAGGCRGYRPHDGGWGRGSRR